MLGAPQILIANKADNNVSCEELEPCSLDHQARPHNPRWPWGQAASPISPLVSPDREPYVALVASDVVAEIDLRAYSVRRLIQAGNQPDGLAWLPLELAAH